MAAVLGLVLAGTAGGCGSQEKSYCEALRADRQVFAEMESDSGTGLLDQLPALQRLGAKAPDDLQDEWQTLLNAVETFRDALRRAGVRPEDFHGGNPPAGLDPATRRAVAEATSALTAPDVVAAATGIEQHALDVCKVQLGL